jgi:hypothetical protein
MPIKMIEDVGAPATVAVVSVITNELAPDWNEWAHYIMTGLGYIGGILGFGGGYVKNLGVASLDGTVQHIYTRVKGGVSSKASVPTSKMTLRSIPTGPVNRPVQRSYQTEFETAGSKAF